MKISSEIKFIIIFFIISRLLLTLVGLGARVQIQPIVSPQYLNQSYADVWAVWDAGWYLNIANQGYSAQPIWQNQANYAFFPLYPLMSRWLGWLIGNSAWAALLIANISLLIAAWYLWKLVKLKFSEKLAYWSVIFLFLFPVSFIFSGLLSEGLFLALLLATFYYAEKKSWLLAGILGFCLALTRSLGVAVALPLLLIYAAQRNYDWKKIDWKVLYLAFIPLGLFVFMAFNEWLTNSWLAFITIQKAWHHFAANPLVTLYQGLFSANQYWIFNSALILAVLIFIIVYWKKITTPYAILSLLFISVPLASSVTSLNSMSRYLAVVFPIFWVLAEVAKNKWWRWILIIIFCLAQVWLMATWTRSGFWIV